jgi:hypothetical protein
VVALVLVPRAQQGVQAARPAQVPRAQQEVPRAAAKEVVWAGQPLAVPRWGPKAPPFQA